MGSKTIHITEPVYERLETHKRDDESVSDALERILRELESDWRTNVGFLAEEETAEFQAEVDRGLAEVDDSLDEFGEDIDMRVGEEWS